MRDKAYENREKELVTELYPLIASLARLYCSKNKRGRPLKVTPAKAAFLAVVKEDGKETPYRKLASSEWVEVLKIEKVHYTTIHKAIKRLAPSLLESVSRILGERVTGGKMNAVIDATGVKVRKYEIKEYRGEERRKRQDVKLNEIWDADEKVFHAADVKAGDAHEYPGSEEMYNRVGTRIENFFGDSAYAGRDFVQTIADSGATPVIKPPSNATPKTKGSPAWRKLVSEFQELGYEDWRDRSGYGKRFPNEGQFGCIVSRFGGEANVRSKVMAKRVIHARIVAHNFFQYQCKRN